MAHFSSPSSPFRALLNGFHSHNLLPPSLTTYMTFWKLWVGAQDTAGTQEGDDRCFSDTGCSQDSLGDMKRGQAGRGKRGETVEASTFFSKSILGDKIRKKYCVRYMFFKLFW